MAVVHQVAAVLQVVVVARLTHEAVVGLTFGVAAAVVTFEAAEAAVEDLVVALGSRGGKLFT